MRISVTTFYSLNYVQLAAITIPPLEEWCNKHGYHLNVNVIEDGNKHHFVKTKDARRLLEDYDLVMAIENDILLTNLNYRIHDFIDYQHDFFIAKDVNNYNGGCFIVKAPQAKPLSLQLSSLNLSTCMAHWITYHIRLLNPQESNSFRH